MATEKIDNFPWKKFFFDEFYEPIILLNENFLILDVNTKLLDLCGYDREELLGKSPNIILEHISMDFKLVESQPKEQQILSSKLITKSAIKIPIKLAFHYHFSETGLKKWYIFSFIKDISHETHLLRQLNAIKSYALSTYQISTVIYRQTLLGPDIWYKEKVTFLDERFSNWQEKENELLKIGLILTTALGQGGAYTKGLSEIPVYDYDIIGVCYTKIVYDQEAQDERLKDKTYIIIATFFPRELSSLILKHDELEGIIRKILTTVTNIKQLDTILVERLKKSIIKLEEDAIDYIF